MNKTILTLSALCMSLSQQVFSITKETDVAYIDFSKIEESSSYGKELVALRNKKIKEVGELAVKMQGELMDMDKEMSMQSSTNGETQEVASKIKNARNKSKLEAEQGIRQVQIKHKEVEINLELEEAKEKTRESIKESISEYAKENGFRKVEDPKTGEVLYYDSNLERTKDASDFVEKKYKQGKRREGLLASMTSQGSEGDGSNRLTEKTESKSFIAIDDSAKSKDLKTASPAKAA